MLLVSRHRLPVLVLSLALTLPVRPLPAVAAEHTARVQHLETKSEDRSTRITLQLSAPIRYRTLATGSMITVDVWMVTGDSSWAGRLDQGIIGWYTLKPLRPGVARLTVTLREPSRFKVFTTANRLSLVVFPQYAGAVALPRSVGYQLVRVPTGAGVARVHVVTLDTRGENLMIRPALGGAAVAATETISTAATRMEALAAINGNFYSRAGLPLGLVVIDGRVLSAPLGRRPVFAVDGTGRPWIGTADFSGRLVTDTGLTIPVLAVNRPPRSGGIAVYTPEFGPVTFPQAMVAIVRDGRVIGFSSGRPLIPLDGVALAAAASEQGFLLSLVRGQQVRIELNLSPPGIHHGIQGGPRLVRGGQVVVPYQWEGFTRRFHQIRTARSAVGITGPGKVLFVTVDGRNHLSTGVNLPELAVLMRRLGAVDAMNLDGGGSSTLVVGGRVVSALPRGGERQVSSMLIAVRRPPARSP